MRSIRTLAAAAVVCVGLVLPAAAQGAPLQFFTETTHAGIDSWVMGATPLVGDFDADGDQDVFLYWPGAGHEMLLAGNHNREGWMAFGGQNLQVNGNYKPIVGDFNGNGTTDILWYAPGTGK